MNNYFENFYQKIDAIPENDFFSKLRKVEEELKNDCLKIAQDSDTPKKWKRKIIQTIYLSGNEKCPIRRRPILGIKLSDLFSQIALKRIKTRYGVITDNPGETLRLINLCQY